MKQMLIVLCFVMLCAAEVSARQTPRPAGRAYAPPVRAAAYEKASLAAAGRATEDADALLDDDPAYARYKEGYNAILEENWTEAKKRLDAVIDAFPKSEYRDDAEYWRSYALMHIDRKKAKESYEKFVKNFPKSTYYDDAVSDLDRLNSGVVVISSPSSSTSVYYGDDGYGYAFSSDSAASASAPSPSRITTRQMRALEHDLSRLTTTLPRVPRLPRMPNMSRVPMAAIASGGMRTYTVAGELAGEEKLDPDTQLKLDALYAIGDAKEDEKSYQALKTVALDVRAHERLRTAALDIVSNYKKFDVLAIYTEIARSDTSEEMQSYAVDYISNNSKDKNKSVQTLIELFNGTPKSREEQKRRIFFSIAEVGNDRAVDFLASVAKTSDNYDLRREAVYYLGTMGSDKARTALYDILQGTKER